MGEEKQISSRQEKHVQWAIGKKKDEEGFESMETPTTSSSSFSSSSLSSSEMADDASSSNSASSSSSSNGPLFELAELMAQLPIKRGLSKFYNGKSETFGSLANVKGVEDLAKKETSYNRRMKSCKSYVGNLNQHKFGPKATITKRTSPKRSSFTPASGFLGAKGAMVCQL